MSSNEFQTWREQQRNYWNNRIKTRGNLLSVAPTKWMNKRKEQLKKYGCSGEQVDELVLSIFRTIQANLMEQVMLVVVERWLSFATSKQADHLPTSRIILDIGVGTGEFAVRMTPLTLKKGYSYVGVDFAEESIATTKLRLEMLGLQGDLIKLEQGVSDELPASNDSVWLAVWGKFGQHLTYGDLWEQSTSEVKRVISPGGYFLVYETMQEHNEEYTKKMQEEDPNNKGTLFRSREEYDAVLFPMERIETIECNFCDEVFTIALWQKPL